ncbi:hypothetical protein BC939DRAFT_471231 [Gamsiella multidivaricata]|uniref:uncharacterized protein n=1 Tax=Gamsiella multidivaricata TaxID=101098 RepID=UPI002220BCA9|nr:uncharacterized protein BC939DRAFT_471231 [Gamsiella multidivaricata]KAI7815856.1 hypothetical protein BC939DRAFT_471231 [Gamsiella multidivaricata]
MDSLLSGTPPSPTWVMCASNQNRNPHSNQARPCQQELKIPVQVWAHICSYLYPSQLAQLSLVNRTAYEIVAGLETWSKWYRRLSGKAEKLARQTEPMELLPGLPESRSYMLYMCAISFQVCEGCFRRCDGRRIRGRLALMPLPVVLSNGDGEGGSGNERERGEGGELWTVRLCKHCRVMHYEKHPEAIPQELTTKFLTRREIKAQYHLGKSEIKAIKVRSHGERSMCMPVTYSEAEALKTARVVFGGDVGRQAVPRSLCRPMAKVHHRVYMYNLRRRTLEAGGEWFRCQDYKARKAAGLLD